MLILLLQLVPECGKIISRNCSPQSHPALEVLCYFCVFAQFTLQVDLQTSTRLDSGNVVPHVGL